MAFCLPEEKVVKFSHFGYRGNKTTKDSHLVTMSIYKIVKAIFVTMKTRPFMSAHIHHHGNRTIRVSHFGSHGDKMVTFGLFDYNGNEIDKVGHHMETKQLVSHFGFQGNKITKVALW